MRILCLMTSLKIPLEISLNILLVIFGKRINMGSNALMEFILNDKFKYFGIMPYNSIVALQIELYGI